MSLVLVAAITISMVGCGNSTGEASAPAAAATSEAAAEESERNGIWTLEALIFDDNLPSLELFRKCGYTDLGVRPKLGYDEVLKKWRNVAMLERRSEDEKFS